MGSVPLNFFHSYEYVFCPFSTSAKLIQSLSSTSSAALKMAPSLTDTVQQHFSDSNKPVSRSVFPDGIKTSGQHPPLYKELKPYEDFPNEIAGATVWNADDYKNNPERWTHHFTDEEIAELSRAADDFRAAAIPLTGISKVRRDRLLRS